MTASGDFGNPLRKFKLVFLGEQSGRYLSDEQGEAMQVNESPAERHLDFGYNLFVRRIRWVTS